MAATSRSPPVNLSRPRTAPFRRARNLGFPERSRSTVRGSPGILPVNSPAHASGPTPIGDISQKAPGEGCESGVVPDPQRVGYGDPPFRPQTLHGNPGVAGLQGRDTPLQCRADITIGY